MNAVEEAYRWLSLLVIWVALLVFGGIARCVWVELIRPRWLRRLRRLEAGREEQRNA
jgi:hypothetical protein